MVTSKIEFIRRPYGDMSTKEQGAVRALVRESVEADYPGFAPRSIRYFTQRAEAVRRNPHARGPEGQRLLRGSFARPLSLLAIREGYAVAHLFVADNASSSRAGALGAVERHVKLHRPEARPGGRPAIERRYTWFGHLAVSPEVREAMSAGNDQATIVDGLVALALDTRDDRQWLTAYPYDQEELWRDELTSLGFGAQPGEDEFVRPFGPQGPRIHQERWAVSATTPLAHNVGDVRQLILAKPGGEQIVAQAHAQLAA